ncbi:MAG TPA: hypothetical protein VJC16_05150 [Candidatus Nanoarchaeia archaeon]|nr:hypothetical protein [Candidatus Nanoarchaeia archaeon]
MRKHLGEAALFAGSVIFLSLVAFHYGAVLSPDTWSYSVYAQELREGRLPVYSHDGSFLSTEFF